MKNQNNDNCVYLKLDEKWGEFKCLKHKAKIKDLSSCKSCKFYDSGENKRK